MTANADRRPLAGVRVLDFSTLLPGPMCSLLLAEAGAEVIKIERPGRGDEMRTYPTSFGSDSANFALLNRGKRSFVCDLKDLGERERVLDLVRDADVLIEQFRAGVMARLGLDYASLSAINPRLIYCSITGYGQSGPLADVAAHDLNYLAETGMLGLGVDATGAPPLPQALIADLAGGAYPAMMNILLALRQRDASGQGCRLDVAMADNLFTLMYESLGEAWVRRAWPTPGSGLVTGGSARYQVYRTADARYLACAPLEDRFWSQFLQVIGAPHLQDDSGDPAAIRDAIAAIIATQTQAHWLEKMQGLDVCVSPVRSLQGALAHEHFVHRGIAGPAQSVRGHRLDDGGGQQIPALPVPIDAQFRGEPMAKNAPRLGEWDPK